MITFAIAGYLIGILTFCLFALFDQPIWVSIYAIWRSLFGASLFGWYALYKISGRRELIAPMIMFAGLVFVWEIISIFTGLYINNEPVVALFFILAIGITGYYLFYPKSPMVQFLIKYLP